MPHGARKMSSSGYYHVVPKGIRDQIIFESDADRRLYVELLAASCEPSDVKVHAYCLMSNHVHLVVEDPQGQLSAFMKYIDERYASYFVLKSGAIGGIFRKPFWSEPIESDEYLLCAVRYVHANPAVAGICRASAYEWSSVKDYLGRDGLTHTETVSSMLGGREGFIEFSKLQNVTAVPFPGSTLKRHFDDDEALRLACGILGFDARSVSQMSVELQRTACGKLLAHGFSIAQTARITGVGKRRIEWFSRQR